MSKTREIESKSSVVAVSVHANIKGPRCPVSIFKTCFEVRKEEVLNLCCLVDEKQHRWTGQN